jgi:hypothetical protein
VAARSNYGKTLAHRVGKGSSQSLAGSRRAANEPVPAHLQLNAFQHSNDNRDLQIDVLGVTKRTAPRGDQT